MHQASLFPMSLLACAMLCGGCSSRVAGPQPSQRGTPDATTDANVAPPPDADVSPLVVRVGVPDPENTLAFAPIPADQKIKIRMGGQGGTHAILGLQCEGFGNRIFYEIRVRDPIGGTEVASPALPAPRPIICDMSGVCKLVPINVVLGGLATPEQWPGLAVDITLTISNADGLQASTRATGILDPT